MYVQNPFCLFKRFLTYETATSSLYACTIVGTKHSQTINVSVGDAPLILTKDNALCNNILNL